MIWGERRTVTLDELRLPPDWDERLAAAHVSELAASIKQTGGRPINLPTIEAASMEVVAGADRLAALVVGGETRFEVETWSGSAAEKEIVRCSENAKRRQDADKWVKRLVDAIEARRAEEKEFQDKPSGNAGGKKKEGRPRSSRGESRREAAALLGRSPEAVRKADERASVPDLAPEIQPDPREPVIDLHALREGETVPLDVDRDSRELREALDDASRYAQAAQRAIDRAAALRKSIADGPFAGTLMLDQVDAEAARKTAHDLFRQIALMNPASLCRDCRGGEWKRTCTLCLGNGFLTAGVRAAVGKSEEEKRLLVTDSTERTALARGETKGGDDGLAF